MSTEHGNKSRRGSADAGPQADADTLIRPNAHSVENYTDQPAPFASHDPAVTGADGIKLPEFDINAPTAAQPLPQFSGDGNSDDEVELDLSEVDEFHMPFTDHSEEELAAFPSVGEEFEDEIHNVPTQVNLDSGELRRRAAQAPPPASRRPAEARNRVGPAVSSDDDQEDEETLQLRRPTHDELERRRSKEAEASATQRMPPPRRPPAPPAPAAPAPPAPAHAESATGLPPAPPAPARAQPKATRPSDASKVASTQMVPLEDFERRTPTRNTATVVLNAEADDDGDWDGDTLAGDVGMLEDDDEVSVFDAPAIARWQVDASRLGEPVKKGPSKAIALDEPIKHKVQTVLWNITEAEGSELDDTPAAGIDPRIQSLETPALPRPSLATPPPTAPSPSDTSAEDMDLAAAYLDDAINFVETLRTYGAFMDVEARRGYEAAIAGCGQKLRRALTVLQSSGSGPGDAEG